MAMTTNEKLRHFADEALGEAGAAAARIRAAAEAARTREFEAGENEILREVYEYIVNEKKKLLAEFGNIGSSRILEKRRELLRAREDAIERITAAVRERLLGFVKTPEYRAGLARMCVRVLDEYPSCGEICLSAADAAGGGETLAAVAAAAGGGSGGRSVRSSPDILIGGAMFISRTENIIINETIDENLRRCREKIIALISPAADIAFLT